MTELHQLFIPCVVVEANKQELFIPIKLQGHVTEIIVVNIAVNLCLLFIVCLNFGIFSNEAISQVRTNILAVILRVNRIFSIKRIIIIPT